VGFECQQQPTVASKPPGPTTTAKPTPPSRQPYEQLMHAQEVDFLCSRLAVESDLDLMFGASISTDASARECITVHSLDVEHLLAYRYRFAPSAPKGGPGSACLINHVASLHPIGGALSRCCVASYGGRLVVFEVPASMPAPGSTLSRTHSTWDAHPGAFVTALQLSHAAPTLYSGANDGVIHSWDLRTRPTAPVSVMAGHQRNVTALALVHESCLASCGVDTKVGRVRCSGLFGSEVLLCTLQCKHCQTAAQTVPTTCLADPTHPNTSHPPSFMIRCCCGILAAPTPPTRLRCLMVRLCCA